MGKADTYRFAYQSLLLALHINLLKYPFSPSPISRKQQEMPKP